jgi:hypothetical protein
MISLLLLIVVAFAGGFYAGVYRDRIAEKAKALYIKYSAK